MENFNLASGSPLYKGIGVSPWRSTTS